MSQTLIGRVYENAKKLFKKKKEPKVIIPGQVNAVTNDCTSVLADCPGQICPLLCAVQCTAVA